MSDRPLLCHRCGCSLTPGEGAFHVVRIEAFADPSPPADALEASDPTAWEWGRLLKELEDLSERELMDQVYRRLVIHLCNRCYASWIENPTG